MMFLMTKTIDVCIDRIVIIFAHHFILNTQHHARFFIEATFC